LRERRSGVESGQVTTDPLAGAGAFRVPLDPAQEVCFGDNRDW
jgi:hypothetical protein